MARKPGLDWTIFFLIQASDDDGRHAVALVEALRAVPLGETVKIVICVQLKKPFGGAWTTMFYRIEKGNLLFLSETTGFDMTDPADLAGYFTRYVLEGTPTGRYLLFTWGHGRGYGIFPKPETGRVLTMERLQVALGLAFGTRKVDLVVMMNCYMQFFDTGYALAPQASILLAPESFMAYEGYHYEALLSRLRKEPSIDARRLAAHIVRSFPRKPGLSPFTLAYTALSANDLSLYESLAEGLDELADRLSALWPDHSEALLRAAAESFVVYSAFSLRDFYSFLYQVQQAVPGLARERLFIDFWRWRKEMVIAGYRGKGYDSLQHFGCPNAFSIFLPAGVPAPRGMGAASWDRYEQTLFSTNGRWAVFKHRFEATPSPTRVS
jgi:hypothetical protein